MGLFTNPVTLSDGTDNHIFSYRSPVFDKRSIVAEYIETAAAIAAESVLRVKHDPKSAAPRHLLQRQVFKTPAAGTELKLITVNLTLTADKEFTAAEVEKEVNILLDGMAEADVVKSLLSNMT